MKNGIQIFKYLSPVIVTLIIVWFIRDLKCGRDGGGNVKNDTILITRDTTYILHDTTIAYIPRPYKVEVIKDSIVWLERQPEFKDFPPIAQRWIEDYHTRKFYDTTLNVQYGTARIKDTVYKNRIVGVSFSLQQSIPEIINTITVSEKPRTVAYWGFSLAGNLSTPLAATEIDFGLKLKNGSYIGLKGMLLRNGEPLYGVQYMRPIRLRKR